MQSDLNPTVRELEVITTARPTSRRLIDRRHGVCLNAGAFGQDELAEEFVGSNQAPATIRIDNFDFQSMRDLRLHLSEGLRGGVGWLFALSDKHMSAVISSMHDEPAHDWTVEELARRAGMSRSTFALRFKKTVWVSPLEYLTRWRMPLAGDRMANTSDSISEIAQSLGYESASAFTKAFKKIMGRSPRQYSRDQNSVSAVDREGEAARANRPLLD